MVHQISIFDIENPQWNEVEYFHFTKNKIEQQILEIINEIYKRLVEMGLGEDIPFDDIWLWL